MSTWTCKHCGHVYLTEAEQRRCEASHETVRRDKCIHCNGTGKTTWGTWCEYCKGSGYNFGN